jgi:predicted AlkP superfamily pyrophosphatase or phosphodiesterase
MDFEPFKNEVQQLVDRRRFLGKFILPDYQQFNIANISSVIGKVFSIKSLQKASLPENYIDDFKGIEKIVLFVLDGFGYNRLLAHIEKFKRTFYDLVDRGTLHALTSTFPSTTSTALTSIFTALPPSEHGVIGFNMFVEPYGLIVNTLDMRPVYGFGHGIDVADDFSNNAIPWSSALKDYGVKVKTLTRRNVIGSGLSKVIHKHQDLIGYALASDMVSQCRKLLEHPEPMFICAYYGGVDTVEHTYGPYSEEATDEIRLLENLLKESLSDRLPTETKSKTLLIVTADHGVVKSLQTYMLNEPQISNYYLIPPTGDLRAAFFFPKYGQEEKLKEALERNIQGFTIMPSKELIEKEAFGPVVKRDWLQTRVGTIAALSQSKNSIAYQYVVREHYQNIYGAHGGMTPEEMIVPLLSTRLSKL